jgi:SWIM/SEC-C metal-binding protein
MAARLGTKKRPAVLRVPNEDRALEVLALAQHHGWQCLVGVEADRDEDVSDLEQLLRDHPVLTGRLNPSRPPKPTEFCPCDSGRKYKKCCGAEVSSTES